MFVGTGNIAHEVTVDVRCYVSSRTTCKAFIKWGCRNHLEEIN